MLNLQISNNLIYALKDPVELGGKIRYIGLSTTGLSRPKEHYRKTKEKNHKSNWIKKLKMLGFNYQIQIIQDIGEYEDTKKMFKILTEAEKTWINFFRVLGCNLVNSTDGGEGSLGRVPSDQWRKNHSEFMKVFNKIRPKTDRMLQTCYKRKEIRIIDNIEHKFCNKCSRWLNLDNYGYYSKSPIRKNSYCFECRRKQRYKYK